MFQSQSPTRTNIEEANKHLKMLYGRVDELERKVVSRLKCLITPVLLWSTCRFSLIIKFNVTDLNIIFQTYMFIFSKDIDETELQSIM